MSKLKPIKDDAELARVPLEEPVLVELEPPATGEDLSARGADADDDAGRDAGGAADDADDIAAQLRAAETARERERERAERAEQREREAREEAENLRASGADAEKGLLTSSLEKAQQERDAAKAAYKRAYEEGDAEAMADANDKIARAAASIVHYEGAIANFDETAKKPAAKAKDINTAIDEDPQLLPAERVWLKQHPEALTDPRLNRKLSVAHDEAIASGHARGSDAYFKSINTFMGYEKDTRGGKSERNIDVSAPVSRDTPSISGRPSPTRIVLTPEERAMAKTMGISETVYARNKLQLEQRKKSDPERYATRG